MKINKGKMIDNNCCRVCGTSVVEQHNVRKLFENESRTLLRKIAKITGLLLKKEANMPEFICEKCTQNLEQAINFRNICIETQKFWRKQIKQNSKKINCEIISENHETDILEKGTAFRLVEVMLENKDDAIIENINEDMLDDDRDEDVLNIELTANDNATNPFDEAHSLMKTSPKLEIDAHCSSSDKRSAEQDSSSKESTYKLKKNRKKQKKSFPKEKNLPFICEQCGTCLPIRSLFETHMRRHNGERIFECDLCPEKFFTKADLKGHRYKHTGERPFPCRHCDRRFFNSSGRVRHERMHTNDRPFVCVECGAGFTTGYVLKKHMLKHTGERNFKCALCQRAFQTQSHLNNHNRSMFHKQNELKQNENVTDCDPKSLSIVS